MAKAIETIGNIGTIHAFGNGVKFTESDIVDLDSWIPRGEYNPHNVRPWLLHDHGFILAVVFASNLQDAIDAAVDADKMERYLISAEQLAADYADNEDGISYLGNAGEPFDIESLGYIELHNPARSFVAQYVASFPESAAAQ